MFLCGSTGLNLPVVLKKWRRGHCGPTFPSSVPSPPLSWLGHIVPLCADPAIPSAPHPSPCPPSSCKLQWLPVATTWVWHSGALKLAPEHLEAICQPSGLPVTSLLTLPAAGLWIFRSWAWPCLTLALTAGPGSHTPSSGSFSAHRSQEVIFLPGRPQPQPFHPPDGPSHVRLVGPTLSRRSWRLGTSRPVPRNGLAIIGCGRYPLLPDLSVVLSMDAAELL